MIHLRVRKTNHLSKYLSSQVTSDSGTNARAKESDQNRCHTHKKCHRNHSATG